MLEPELAIPIYDDGVWSTLTITNQYERGHHSWAGFFRGSPNRFEEGDGSYLVELLKKQQSNPESYPLTDKDKRQLARKRKVRTLDREVEIEVPDDADDAALEPVMVEPIPAPDSRESIQVQAKVSQIGAEMGFRIWVPRNDKARVLELIPSTMHEKFLELLP